MKEDISPAQTDDGFERYLELCENIFNRMEKESLFPWEKNEMTRDEDIWWCIKVW